MRVPPMSMPAWALISSTAIGSRNCFQQVVAQLPPAWGRGTTQTSSQPYRSAASRSMMMARLRCSQHWAASQMPCAASTGAMPTTKTSPFFSFACSSSSVTACRASCSICCLNASVILKHLGFKFLPTGSSFYQPRPDTPGSPPGRGQGHRPAPCRRRRQAAPRPGQSARRRCHRPTSGTAVPA